MGRKREFRKKILVSADPEDLEMIEAALLPGEDRSTFIRTAILAELLTRFRRKLERHQSSTSNSQEES